MGVDDRVVTPVDGSSLTTSWFGSGAWIAAGKPSFGGCLKTSRSSVCVTGSRLPVRMKNGTPAQRQFSISRRSAAYVSVVESGATPSIVEVAVVLAAHVVRRVGGVDRAEERDLCVLERLRVAAGGGSIAAAATTCIRWLTTTSRSAPTGS